MLKLLLHVCCGPCAVSPLALLREAGHDVTGLYFNPNIHPYREFIRRLDTLKEFAETEKLPLLVDERYLLDEFLDQVWGRARSRCENCYEMRLRQTARTAREMGFEAFTSTLLVSPYQQHELIVETAQQIAEEESVAFYYQDFRPAWHQGVAISRQRQMYRQPYCGCIFSERDRYYKTR